MWVAGFEPAKALSQQILSLSRLTASLHPRASISRKGTIFKVNWRRNAFILVDSQSCMALGLLGKLERDLFGSDTGLFEDRTVGSPQPYQVIKLEESYMLMGIEFMQEYVDNYIKENRII